MGTVLLGNLEKVGWVELKCDYAIIANSRDQNHFYYLNNKIFKKNKYCWNCNHKTNRQMFYNINENKYAQRFVQEVDIQNNIRVIYQSDCDVINHHLNEEYNFDILYNKYKHFGEVNKDQVF